MSDYGTEELLIKEELKKLNSLENLQQWARYYCLSEHSLVVEEMEKYISAKLSVFVNANQVKKWAAAKNIQSHRLVLERIEYLESFASDNSSLFYAEDEVAFNGMDNLASTQDVRRWSHELQVTKHPAVERKLGEINCLISAADVSLKRKSEEETTNQSNKTSRCGEKRFQCRKCPQSFKFLFIRNRHEQRCTGPALPLRNHECGKCKARFVTSDELERHQSIHQPVHRPWENKPLHRPWENQIGSGEQREHEPQPGPSGLSHITDDHMDHEPELCQPQNTADMVQPRDIHGEVGKTTRCHQCDEIFSSRRAFYLHRMLKHQQHGDGDLQSVPWDRAPWEDEDGNVDEDMKTVFEANAPFINASHKPGEVRETYNYPLNNDINTDEIINRVEEIFHTQHRAFRINFMFGMVLRHVETGELRYFIPDQNETLLQQPILINKPRDITLKLRNILNTKDIAEFILRQRSDSKWRPVFVTNLKIVIFKSNFLLGCSSVQMPEYIMKNRSIVSLISRSGEPYRDNLCAFRCLATHRGFLQKQKSFKSVVNIFYTYWTEFLLANECGDLTSVLPSNFAGVNFQELDLFESCFHVNVNIYKLKEDGTAELFYRSVGQYEDTMCLNVFENHLSYIRRMDHYAKKYQCRVCQKFFPTSENISRHEKTCEDVTSHKHPGGYRPMDKTIFTRLEEYGIVVPEEDQIYKWFIVFDCEAMLQPIENKMKDALESDDTNSDEKEDDEMKEDGDDKKQKRKKLQWVSVHVPVSVSICSNIDGFREPKCLINGDVNELVKQMVESMKEIATSVAEAAYEKWDYVLESLNHSIVEWTNSTHAGANMMLNALKALKKSMENYCEQVPVLGFNSGKYDLNLLKGYIAKHLNMDDSDEARMTVKRNNNYTCISNKMLKFLDIKNYLAAESTYADFLKAFGVTEAKGFFPYEYLTHIERLEETSLPAHSAFYSHLKNTNISAEDYEFCQRVWEERNMTSLRDFLEWYNNLDVGPFVTAVEKLQEFYFERDLDIFKISLSVPGIARKMLFRAGKQAGASFSLISENDKDLHQTFRDNIVGGPSIIFNRHQKVDETFIRNNPEKPCKSVLGYDANALYLWALNQALPCGAYIRRKEEDQFRPERRDKYMSQFYWMEYMMEVTGQNILHKMNHGKEKRVGPYPVDGYCAKTNTIYQFHGCYYHGHKCFLTKGVKDEEERLRRFERTKKTTEYLRARGYKVIEIRECQYYNLRRNSQKLKEIISKHMPEFYRKHTSPVTERQILDGVLDETLFGMVEVDIEVPERWTPGFEKDVTPHDFFQEMAPLFCTTDIPFCAIGKHMQDHVVKHKLSKNPRRLLVAGMKGEKMLIATPLLRWYLQHGMIVSKIYQVIEYTPMRCFQQFVKEVTEARRQGDLLKELKILADTMKLIGNSAYGGLIMDKSKHRIITYAKGHSQASHLVNNRQFRNITQLDDEYYEVEQAKGKINHDLPIQLGYFILQYAKLRMLQFYYDFFDAYCDRTDFVYCEMDTDSAYMAISGESLSDIIKPSMKHHFEHGLKGFCTDLEIEADTGFHWFPRGCCEKHASMDKRTPGLFKLEFQGEEIISLCSKSYIVKNSQKTKFSAKGLQRRNIDEPFNKYEKVLKTGISEESTNKGFRAKDNSIITYEQQRSGFNYFYCKREVLANGIDTKVLDIVLTPEKKDRFDLKLLDLMVLDLADE